MPAILRWPISPGKRTAGSPGKKTGPFGTGGTKTHLNLGQIIVCSSSLPLGLCSFYSVLDSVFPGIPNCIVTFLRFSLSIVALRFSTGVVEFPGMAGQVHSLGLPVAASFWVTTFCH